MSKQTNLLKEAIADAKAVRETAIANAKIALEEAFTPRLQSILSKRIQSEMEEEDDEVVEDEMGSSDAVLDDTEDVSEEEDAEAESYNEEDEVDSELEEEDEIESEEGDSEEDFDLEDEDESEDDLDLESIIRELEDELEEEEDETVEEEEIPGVGFDDPTNADDSDISEEEEDEVDLDEILREMGYGDDEEVSEEEEEDSAHVEELEAELEEAYGVIKSLKRTINEVNLLNAKLLYTNKLFRSYDLSNEQKHKVVETLDRTSNVREVKLVFATLAESLSYGGSVNKKARKINESFASKAVKSTAPKKEIINENANLVTRFQELANINKK